MRFICLLLAITTACGSAPPETFGDFCLDYAPIVCDVADECFGETIRNCEDEIVAICCGDDGTCARPAREISRRDYNRCLNDLEDRTCASWTGGAAFPASCQTL